MAVNVTMTRSLQIARETVEQGVMLGPQHTAVLLVLIDDLEARLTHLERAAIRSLAQPADAPATMHGAALTVVR
jgi:hypothetical protein